MSGGESEAASETGTNRRGWLKRIVGGATLLVLGVLGVLGWQYVTRPEVALTDVERRDGRPDLYTVTVRNDGGPGRVLVILRLFGESDAVVKRREREIEMDGRTTRELSFEVSAPESDRYQFEVDPLDFPERIVN